MQVVDHGTATEIEKIFAQPLIASAPSLPSTDMRERMLNHHSLAQFVATFGSLLSQA